MGKPYSYRKIRRLFLMTLLNEHPDYRFTFTADVLILLSLVYVFIPFSKPGS